MMNPHWLPACKHSQLCLLELTCKPGTQFQAIEKEVTFIHTYESNPCWHGLVCVLTAQYLVVTLSIWSEPNLKTWVSVCPIYCMRNGLTRHCYLIRIWNIISEKKNTRHILSSFNPLLLLSSLLFYACPFFVHSSH